MKTVIQALRDEIYYPIPNGKVENIAVRRGLTPDEEYSYDVAQTTSFKGALADCLYSLLQAVNFSEADKSIGSLSDSQRKAILKLANSYYTDIGEDEKEDAQNPKVYINC